MSSPPQPALSRSPRVLVGAALVVAVIAVFVVVTRQGGADLRVVEIGFSEVVEADPLPDGSDVDEGQPLVSWAAIVENTGDRLARNVHVDVTLVDDSGEVIDETFQLVEVLPPDQQMAVTGFSDERPSDVTDVRVEIDGTERWERWEETSDAVGITTDDLETAYGPANQPIVTFTATSHFDATIRERTAHAVGRDRSGRIVAGWSGTALPGEPPLDPGEPVDAAASARFTVADLATVEVYVEPTGGAS